MQPCFFHTYEEFSGLRLDEFQEKLFNTRSKRIADVTISDLCAMSEYPNGLYFFYHSSPKALAYVGKCTSRSFIERVPSHFDTRESAWFNTLPKKLAAGGMPYGEALAAALHLEIVMLGIRDPLTAGLLEATFRHTFAPKLNTPSKPSAFPLELTLEQVVQNKIGPYQHRAAGRANKKQAKK